MAYYDAPDTGTWDASQEERDRLRQENYEKNKEGLQNALNESQKRQEEERENNPGQDRQGVYTWSGDKKKPKQGNPGNLGNPTKEAEARQRELENRYQQANDAVENSMFNPNGRRPGGGVTSGPGFKGGMPKLPATPATTTTEPAVSTEPKVPKSTKQNNYDVPEIINWNPPSQTTEAADTASKTKDELTRSETDYNQDDWWRVRDQTTRQPVQETPPKKAGNMSVPDGYKTRPGGGGTSTTETYNPPKKAGNLTLPPGYRTKPGDSGTTTPATTPPSNPGVSNQVNPGLRTGATAPTVYDTSTIPGLYTERTVRDDYGLAGQVIGKVGQSLANIGSYEDFLAEQGRDKVFSSEADRVQWERDMAAKYNEMAANGNIPGLTTSRDIAEKVYGEPGSYTDALRQAEKAGLLPGTPEYDAFVSKAMNEAGAKTRQPGNNTNPGRTGVNNGINTTMGNSGNNGGGSTYTYTPETPEQKRARLDRETQEKLGGGTNTGTNTNMPGMGTPGGKTAPGAIDTTKVTGANGGTTGGTTTGGTTTGSNTGNGTAPKGTKYYDPSYGQGGTVAKAPYKYKGYTEDELIAMGNRAYGKKYGVNMYEGYYQAPDGAYYPVDQAKANYWRQNGGSYAGWDEGMRGYYNTYGTFYGYRPDWKTSGKGGSSGKSYGGGGKGKTVWNGGVVKKGGSSSSSSSYSYGGGNNYGSGYTPNNGLYWNGNTSWSIS